MHDARGSTFSFLSLRSICKRAKARKPQAYRTMFSSSSARAARREAFLLLQKEIDAAWLATQSSGSTIPGRRRMTMALYALVLDSPMANAPDSEIERLTRDLIPGAGKPAHAVVSTEARAYVPV